MEQLISEAQKYIPVVLGELNRIGLQLENFLPPDVTSSPIVAAASAALKLPVGLTLLAAAAATLLITLLTLIISLRFLAGGSRFTTVVLLGLPGSGKTSLWYKLRDGSTHSGTVTSMAANDDTFPLHSELSKNPKAKPVHIVDVPGHPRLRSQASTHLERAAGAIFLVDSLDFTPHIRSVAEFLYETLTSPAVARRRIPVLVACNKTEKVTAHSVEFIRKQLEKELEKLRISRRAMAAEQSTTGESALTSAPLPVKGNGPFQFADAPSSITFAECSVVDGNTESVESFIRSVVPQ